MEAHVSSLLSMSSALYYDASWLLLLHFLMKAPLGLPSLGLRVEYRSESHGHTRIAPFIQYDRQYLQNSPGNL